jgi:chromosome segregation ATPase
MEKASHLSESCRNMLLAGIPKAFETASEERHQSQAALVSMVGEVLQEVLAKIDEAAAEEQGRYSGIEARKAELDSALATAEQQHSAAAEEAQTKTATMAEATRDAQSAKVLVQEKEEQQRSGDAATLAAQQEKIALEEVMKSSWAVIVEGQSDAAADHCSALTPFFKDMNLDQSLMSALPSSCKKKCSERGSFDTMVLDQIETQFKGKLAALVKVIDEAAPAAQQRAAAVEEARAGLEKAVAAQQAAVEALTAATSAQNSAAAAVQAAKDAVEAFEAEHAKATKARDEIALELENFKEYNIASFEMMRDRASAKAIAGA